MLIFSVIYLNTVCIDCLFHSLCFMCLFTECLVLRQKKEIYFIKTCVKHGGGEHNRLFQPSNLPQACYQYFPLISFLMSFFIVQMMLMSLIRTRRVSNMVRELITSSSNHLTALLIGSSNSS